ncbi:sce7726 family protein [Winslowiella sp. 2C04]|uniref:sce7726 family protein n=1 Tax=Winslowiella sp. 2C04 TaxID=3416179 RepID=UPI003CEE5995
MLTTNCIAKVFSKNNIENVSNGDFSHLAKIVKAYTNNFNKVFTLADIFDFCFDILRKEYRNEYFYKNIIANKLLMGRHSLSSSTMLSEFRVGGNKADCVIINQVSTCYEIKTDFDNLNRLERQLKSYIELFDKVYVVVSDKHLQTVSTLIPVEVGIINLTNKSTLKEIKKAEVVKRKLNISMLMHSLRIEEYKYLVKSIYGYVPQVSNTEIFSACEELLLNCDNALVRTNYKKTLLKTRDIDKSFLYSLPSSLKITGINSDLKKQHRENLINNIHSTYSKDLLCTSLY